MGIIGDSLDQADQEVFTRPIPKTAAAQTRFLLKQAKGSTKAVAQRLGVSQRTVQRYLAGRRKHPTPAVATRLEAEVRKDWQPCIRKHARTRAATTGGITVETRARFGFTAAPGTTDDARTRRITQHLPPAYAARLFHARATGATEQQLRDIVAEGLQEQYFQDVGRRAHDLLVEFTDIDYLDLTY
ncbi:helix-turn-helix domain-containing protein [Streptomyces sp. SCUT-3]|uniref:telomere-protecting terminal protein Tpg n=1 Tax=Streptomyces sp. SCUT-3 TaxID=2684469 RepID=UPI0015F7DF25|nr:helix-turn-helix transcriptional regulator [Streptomyces sp. SCUT-3]QMV20469.1 helix-turn-helix domain-containing protein [Streptomyces sp. SCUT-3]